MALALEWRKIRRTGIWPAFIGGSLLAAAIPVINMAFRWENYVGQESSPLSVLLLANWPVMAMLNLFLVLAGACALYHLEYADGAIGHMRALPLWEGGLFFGKLSLIAFLCLPALAVEAAAVAFCSAHWFGHTDLLSLLQSFGFSFVMLLPSLLCSLLAAEIFKNIWTALGVGVICIFMAGMLPEKGLLFSLFPFSLPLRIWTQLSAESARCLLEAAAVESGLLAAAELLLLKIRRWFL